MNEEEKKCEIIDGKLILYKNGGKKVTKTLAKIIELQ